MTALPLRPTRDHWRSAAIVACSAWAAFFTALFFLLAVEMAAVNGSLARATDARTIATEAYCRWSLGELEELRARRRRGELPAAPRPRVAVDGRRP